MNSRTWPAVAAMVALAAVVVGLGAANPPQPGRVGTDALGPESGESVASYLQRADASLADASPDDSARSRWALVSFDVPLTTSDLLDIVGELRVSQVSFRVPVERVQTPIVAVQVPDNDIAVHRAPAIAAARLQAGIVGHDRGSQVAAYSAARLAGDCACVVGATVWAPLDRLRPLTAVPGVRAVQALPGDAVAGSFSVNPLLPSQASAVVPGPDDGPVPALG